VKSAHQIIALLQEDINTLKREAVNDNTQVNAERVNKQRHEEGLFSAVDNKRREKLNTGLSKKSSISKKMTPPVIETVNRFEILHNLNEEESQDALRKNLDAQVFTNNSGVGIQQSSINKILDEIPVIINGRSIMKSDKITTSRYKGSAHQNQTQKQRVMIIGDSHARGCAGNMKHILGNNFKVQGVVKPGAGAEVLTASAKFDIEQLTNKDAVVLWGGTKDVGKNNSQCGIRHIVDFVAANNHTNIILVSVPQRHDLCDWSCVNSEVKRFNRNIRKRIKYFKHVKMVRADQKREDFTTHGLHMNNVGKGKAALKIANTILMLFQKQINEPIKLGWKTECEEDVIGQVALRGDPEVLINVRVNTENLGTIQHDNNLNTQEKFEVGASNNEERIPLVTGQVVLRGDPNVLTNVLTNVRVNPENTETAAKVSNSQEHKVVRTSTRQKKPPTTWKEDFLR
jgi:hypothetical protein